LESLTCPPPLVAIAGYHAETDTDTSNREHFIRAILQEVNLAGRIIRDERVNVGQHSRRPDLKPEPMAHGLKVPVRRFDVPAGFLSESGQPEYVRTTGN
jgi:hypothetical protein